MRDYITFINKYSKKFNFIIDYNTYLEVKNVISKYIDEILSFNGMTFANINSLIDFTMCYLLQYHTPQEILMTDLTEKIEVIVDRVFTYQQDKVYLKEETEEEKNDENRIDKKAFNYIHNDFKNIRYIFAPDFDIKKYSEFDDPVDIEELNDKAMYFYPISEEERY